MLPTLVAGQGPLGFQRGLIPWLSVQVSGGDSAEADGRHALSAPRGLRGQAGKMALLKDTHTKEISINLLEFLS